MRDDLLQTYERELRFIRRMSQEFARAHPEQAEALLLEANKCEDPHVERMIESFALLAARVQQRIDDDFSEISGSLMSILYPHYLAPVPSLALVQLGCDPAKAPPPGGVKVRRGSLLRARPAERVTCRFRTSYDLELFPLSVEGVEIVPSSTLAADLPAGVRSAVSIRFKAPASAPIAKQGIRRLRLHLPGQGAATSRLYELLLREPRGLLVQSIGKSGPGRARLLGPEHVRPVGFAANEALLEYPPESFVGYRILQEYFAFPEKYAFVDLDGLERGHLGAEDTELRLSVLLDDSAADLDYRFGPDDVRLGCTPAVNLFAQPSEPIRLTHRQAEYEVLPDVRALEHHEVYSIQGVAISQPGTSQQRDVLPFYAIRHGREGAQRAPYYAVSRRPTQRAYGGSDVAITIWEPDFDPTSPATEVVHVDLLCTNRDLPSRMEFGTRDDDFQVEGNAEVKRARCLRNPSQSRRSPVAQGSDWRLVSHLALNYLSISDDDPRLTGASGLEALREILKLYDFSDSPVTRRRINGLVGLQSKKIVRPVGRGATAGHARGIQIELELDPQQFDQGSLFLFASVLERFLGLYTSVNSFTQTLVRVRGREGALKRWPPRAGEKQLL